MMALKFPQVLKKYCYTVLWVKILILLNKRRLFLRLFKCIQMKMGTSHQSRSSTFNNETLTEAVKLVKLKNHLTLPSYRRLLRHCAQSAKSETVNYRKIPRAYKSAWHLALITQAQSHQRRARHLSPGRDFLIQAKITLRSSVTITFGQPQPHESRLLAAISRKPPEPN